MNRKTAIIVFAPRGLLTAFSVPLHSLSSFVKPVISNLGFMVDSENKFDKQIKAVVKSILIFYLIEATVKNEACPN